MSRNGHIPKSQVAGENNSMRILILLTTLFALVGCASEPMTPEEYYQRQQTGQALQNLARQLQGPRPTTCSYQWDPVMQQTIQRCF